MLPIDRFPPLDFPVVVVSTLWSGATPEAVEARITRPIEDAISTISGINTVMPDSTALAMAYMVLATIRPMSCMPSSSS